MNTTQTNEHPSAIPRRTLTRWSLCTLLSLLLMGCQSANQLGEAKSNTSSVDSEAKTGGAIPPVETSASQNGDIHGATKMLSARLKAEIYQVRVEAAPLGAIDSKSLARHAGSPAKMLQALSETGSARVLYRFDQPVDLASDTLQLQTVEPIVSASRRTPNGQTFNSIQYQSVGVKIQLTSRSIEGGRKSNPPEITFAVDLNALIPTDVEATPGQKMPSIQTLSLTHREGLEPGRPRIMIATRSASESGSTTQWVYVIRYVFDL